MRIWHRTHLGNLIAATALLSTAASAQIVPSRESLSGLYAGRAYSPHAQRRFPNRLLWGDTHLHTGYSVDAGLLGARQPE